MELHRATGAPVLDARRALVESGGDPTLAARILTRDPSRGAGVAPRSRRKLRSVDGQGPIRDSEPTFLSMSAADALRRIHRGERLRRARVSGLVLEGAFDQPVYMRDVVLLAPRITGYFARDFVLDHCVIERGHLTSIRFGGEVRLTSSTLVDTPLKDLDVARAFDASRLKVVGKFSLTRARFQGKFRIFDGRFASWLVFDACKFDDLVDLRAIVAETGVEFRNCTFLGDVSMRGASVGQKLDFGASHLDGHVDLSRAKLRDYVYLEDVRQGPAQTYSFSNIVADRLLIGRAQLHRRLRAVRAGDYERAAAEYGLLRHNFQALHRYEDEDWAYRGYKRSLRRAAERSWRRPWTRMAQLVDWLFLDIGCGYATSPGRTVRSAVAIVVLFGLAYAVGPNGAATSTASDVEVDFWERVFFGFLSSAAVFTGGLDLGLLEEATGPVRMLLVVEGFLGLLLWGLFIATLTRKVIR
jgi:hypothetical protein